MSNKFIGYHGLGILLMVTILTLTSALRSKYCLLDQFIIGASG